MKPVPVFRAPPRYPLEAWEQYIQGRVLVEFRLDDAGQISELEIIAEEPEGHFRQATLEAMKQWEYCPIQENEPPYTDPHRIVIPFRLARPPDEIPLAPGDLDILDAP